MEILYDIPFNVIELVPLKLIIFYYKISFYELVEYIT